MKSRFSNCVRLFLLAAVILATSRCDVPTTGPDFSYDTGLRAPLIFEKTFVLLGPSDTGFEALFDTTLSAFDSLFYVDPSDGTIFLEQLLDDIDIEALDDGMPELSLDQQEITIGLSDLARQHFSSSYNRTLGVFRLDPDDPLIPDEFKQELPVLADPGGGETDIVLPNLLVPPIVNLIVLSDLRPQSVRFTDESAGVNAMTFELINDLSAHRLTSTDSARPPGIRIFQNGVQVGSSTFDFVQSGTMGSAVISLAGATLTRQDLTYRLDISTIDGPGPILADPGAVRIRTRLSPLIYESTTVTDVPAQDGISISSSDLRLKNLDVGVDGLVASSGSATIRITNTLPVPLQMDYLEVMNATPVGPYPSGHVFLRLSGHLIGAGATTEIPVDLSGAAIAPIISISGLFSTPGSTSSVLIDSEQGVLTTIKGNVVLDEVFFRPSGEVYESAGTLDIGNDDVHFIDEVDHVTFDSGSLRIDRLLNGLNLGFDLVEISIPQLRSSPFTPGDSLVLRFEGPSDDPSAFRFRRIERGETRYDIRIDLADMRAYPFQNRLSYHVAARSETSSQTRSINLSDRLEASISVINARLSGLKATIDPISVSVTEDLGEDGRLDIMNDAEALIIEVGELRKLSEQAIDGLELSGTELTFTTLSNIGASIDLYAVLAGISSDGSIIFLEGTGEHAVPPGDMPVDRFYYNGTPLRADQLIRFRLLASPGGGQTRRQTILLNGTNSNVDAFLSELPTQIRFAGQAILQAGGGPVELMTPLNLDASIGVSLPLKIGSDFTFEDTVDADLSSLNDLTDPEKDVNLTSVGLRLDYLNNIPLGIDARLEFLGDFGDVVVTIPREGAPAMILNPASASDNGIASSPTAGTVEISLNEDAVRQLYLARRLRLRLSLISDGSRPAYLRANDTIQLSVNADFRFRVAVRD